MKAGTFEVVQFQQNCQFTQNRTRQSTGESHMGFDLI
jgi:hypothetical protein